MGKPGASDVASPAPECIGCVEGTRGSETSQYPQEEKTTVIPRVVASESGGRLNRVHARPGRGCARGVVGFVFPVLPDRASVRKSRVRRSRLERRTAAGESPVAENARPGVACPRVAAGPWNLL
jgi:hypothetical protein